MRFVIRCLRHTRVPGDRFVRYHLRVNGTAAVSVRIPNLLPMMARVAALAWLAVAGFNLGAALPLDLLVGRQAKSLAAVP
jgi:hypothetical protein